MRGLFHHNRKHLDSNKLKSLQNLQKILDTIAAILGIFGLVIATIEV